jgi:hypothetical protein
MNGSCGTCGGLGQQRCGNGIDCTAAFTIEDNGICVACGDPGQPCCDGVGGGFCKSGNCSGGDRCQ